MYAPVSEFQTSVPNSPTIVPLVSVPEVAFCTFKIFSLTASTSTSTVMPSG